MKRLLVAVMVAAFVVGCEYSQEQNGALEIQALALADCSLDEAYELGISFVGHDDCDDILYLRLQSSGKPQTEVDSVTIQIAELEQLEEELEQGPVSLSLDSERVRVSLLLNSTCFESNVPLVGADGTLTIQEAQLEHAGSLILEIPSFVFENMRDGETVGTGASLFLNAHLSNALPYKDYPYCP